MGKDLCMLADKDVLPIEDIEKYKDWIVELKIDGERVVSVNGRLINRRGIDVTEQFKHIKIGTKGIFDGEVAFLTDKKKGGDFNTGRRKENWGKCVYIVFDVLVFETEKLLNKPLKDRREYLKNIKGDNLKLIADFEIPKDLTDYEGLMIKNPESRYIFGRSRDWLKVKPTKVMVIDFTDYQGNTDGSITAFNELGLRVKVGKDVDIIKKEIDKEGKIALKVNYLERTEKGLLRQITYNSYMPLE